MCVARVSAKQISSTSQYNAFTDKINIHHKFIVNQHTEARNNHNSPQLSKTNTRVIKIK